MNRKQVMAAIGQVATVPDTLVRSDFSTTDHAGGSGETVILEWQAEQPVALEDGQVYEVTPVATETYTLDGTADNTETVTLSHDFIDAEVTDPNVVAYSADTGNRLPTSNPDYANDTVDVDDGGETGVDAKIHYAVGTQASLELHKRGPSGSNGERLVAHDVALINGRDQNRDPLMFDLNASPVQPVVPSNWSLQFRLDGPFSTEFGQDPINFLVSLPIRRARAAEIEDLASVVRNDSADRV